MTRSGTTVETSERNLPGYALRNQFGRSLDVPPKPELDGEHIGGTGGKYAERHTRADHSSRHLVDRAITAGDEDASCTPLDGLASDLTRGIWTGCGGQRNDVSGLRETGGRALQFLLTFSAKASRNRVID